MSEWCNVGHSVKFQCSFQCRQNNFGLSPLKQNNWGNLILYPEIHVNIGALKMVTLNSSFFTLNQSQDSFP